MTRHIQIERSATELVSFDFVDPDSTIPIAGMLTVHDSSNEKVFYLVDTDTGAKILRLDPDGMQSIYGIVEAALRTIQEITVTDEDLRHASGQQ